MDEQHGDRRDPDSWAMLSAADLLRCFAEHSRSITATVLVFVACAMTIIVAWPNRYSSDGMMYVRLGRSALSIDPTAQASSSVSMQDGRAAEVASVAEMLASREIAERVAKQIGVDELNLPRTWIAKYSKAMTDWLPKSGRKDPATKNAFTTNEYEDQIAIEDAIQTVQDSLSVEVTKLGHTVAVSADAPDPLLAQSIAQAAMDEYGRYHVEAHRSQGSLEFFKKQVETSREAAIKSREKLQAAKSELGWIDAESASAALRERMTKLIIALDDAESMESESESLAVSLGASLASVEEWIPTEVTKGVANNADDTMRNTLYGLQLRGSEELAKLSPNHPRYQIMKSSLDKSEQVAKEEGGDRELHREAVNPVRQTLHSDYETAMAKSAGAKSRRASLEKSLKDAQDELVQLNSNSIALAQLTWESEIAEKNYLEHAKSLEEVRLSDALDHSNLSDVSVIQNASLKLKKTGPPRLLLGVASCVVGLCLGLLQALLRHRVLLATDSLSMQSSAPLGRTSASRIVDAERFASGQGKKQSNIRYEIGHVTKRGPSNRDTETENESEFAVAGKSD